MKLKLLSKLHMNIGIEFEKAPAWFTRSGSGVSGVELDRDSCRRRLDQHPIFHLTFNVFELTFMDVVCCALWSTYNMLLKSRLLYWPTPVVVRSARCVGGFFCEQTNRKSCEMNSSVGLSLLWSDSLFCFIFSFSALSFGNLPACIQKKIKKFIFCYSFVNWIFSPIVLLLVSFVWVVFFFCFSNT